MNLRTIITSLLVLCAATVYSQSVNFVVDKDGKGDFKTIQEAVYAVRDFKPGESAHIFVRNGVYNEKLVVPTYKCNLIIEGESRDGVVITCNDYAALNGMGTFRTYTMFVGGNDIELKNLTIANAAGRVGQAVALHLEGDRVVIRNCRLLGNQDTLFAGREGARQTFVDCYIEGTTDFIFGPSTVWFEHCKIHCKADSYITAASTPRNIEYGFIFNDCDITVADDVKGVFLGRPWREYGMTLFMNCRLPAKIRPEGWHNWGKPAVESTARYYEYKNSDEGADRKNRVKWSKELSDEQAQRLLVQRDTSFTLAQTTVKERKTRPYINPAYASLPKGVCADEDVVYSTITDRAAGIRDLHLDIYRPDNDKKLPALLMIHGGGWNSGDKVLQRPMAQRIASQGFVAIPVEYRLIPDAIYPAAVYDIKDAVRWVKANADKYGIDSSRVAISGCSAGGHLANLIGMSGHNRDMEYPRANFDVSSAVKAVINVDGLSTFIKDEIVGRAQKARDENQKLPVDMVWLGGTYAEKKDNWTNASPLTHVNAASPPVCFINSAIERFHAGRDEQIAAMKGYGIYTEVHTLPDTPHPFWFFEPWFEPTTQIMVKFLNKTLKY